ncbi:MAG: VOC family protein [Alphaproteobacteria bacterium]|jgi:lactoylglutathione lyase|nr:VOC family protein [Alphaproteobacteria bacterium]MBT4018322.1 VOC family protein [Alphaproteobacteria bacterium]MBT5158878.1 VOC family protein [Alphaproteobacteria bacterium]MBT7746189.1 VOC family protein [Alphaproteobacteria bacterium]
MLDIVKIDHVGIRVSDRDEALKFYGLLGYELMADGGFDHGHPLILQHSCGIVLNLLGQVSAKAGENVLMDADDKYPGYTHMALHVSSVEAAEKMFEENGVSITGRHQFKGITTIFVRDPDRNVVEIVEHTGPDFFSEKVDQETRLA